MTAIPWSLYSQSNNVEEGGLDDQDTDEGADDHNEVEGKNGAYVSAI